MVMFHPISVRGVVIPGRAAPPRGQAARRVDAPPAADAKNALRRGVKRTPLSRVRVTGPSRGPKRRGPFEKSYFSTKLLQILFFIHIQFHLLTYSYHLLRLIINFLLRMSIFTFIISLMISFHCVLLHMISHFTTTFHICFQLLLLLQTAVIIQIHPYRILQGLYSNSYR